MVTEAQKRASAKWSKQNMTSVACKLTKTKATQFKEACKKLGTVPNQVLLKTVNDTIERAEEE